MAANTGLNFFQSIDYDTIGKLIATCSLTKSCGGDRMVVGFTTWRSNKYQFYSLWFDPIGA
jgi:hypothetical protein